MHSAVPLCDDCGEPIRRYVKSFSGASVGEEIVACDCQAVTVTYGSDREPPADSIPDAWS